LATSAVNRGGKKISDVVGSILAKWSYRKLEKHPTPHQKSPKFNFFALISLPVIHIPMRRFYAEPSLAQALLNLIRDEHGPMVPTGAPE
jgi:hypothetical protein